MDKATREERKAVAVEWREAGERFKEVTGRLVEAFRAGWTREHPAGPSGLRNELRAFARQLDEAARAVRQAADQADVSADLDRARDAVKHAASDTARVVRKDIEYVAEAFAEAEHM